VTMFACLIDSAGLTYTIAGHERPMVLRRGGPAVELYEAVTMPIGISLDTPMPKNTIEFGVGDLILVVTDGVTDSPPFSKDPHRLSEVFAAQARLGAQAVCDRVVELLDEAGAIRDDAAVVCIQRVSGAPS
jgi:serine phosphatase RsbU (regulator of sigma subunit)